MSQKNIPYLIVHGHFYQPPRENPWLEAIEQQDSASPFHDWNERITYECYNPNSVSKIVNCDNKVLDLVNNYELISFNFGATLMSWMEKHSPKAYERIIKADIKSVHQHNGHGNALAQVYNHIIMPLANYHDKQTQVIWGIMDFKYRFGRNPEGMWLAETAVDDETLKVLAQNGIKYTVLSPFQADKIRKIGTNNWEDVSWGNIDPRRPYRYYIKDDNKRKENEERKYIDLFFYDGAISKSVAFDNLLSDGNKFIHRLKDGIDPNREEPQVVNIATDGESYGHHTKFGDMALAYALRVKAEEEGFKLSNYAEFLSENEIKYEVEIKQASSWSCFHGVERWRNDCGCQTGGEPYWNQKWRCPLRNALNFLRDKLIVLFENEGKKYFNDVWEARNQYIDVILDRNESNIKKFFSKVLIENREFNENDKVSALKLLEIQRQAMLMFTSCGWFFAELSGLEPVQILKYAAFAMQLASDFTDENYEEQFLDILEDAQSNIPQMGNGRDVYNKFVKPCVVTLKQIASLWALKSIYEDFEEETTLYSYTVKQLDYKKVSKNTDNLVMGHLEIKSIVTNEKSDIVFALLQFSGGDFHCAIKKYNASMDFEKIKEDIIRAYMEEPITSVIRKLDEQFGISYFTLKDVFLEERRQILNILMKDTLNKFSNTYQEIYDENKGSIYHLQSLGMKIPDEFKIAAQYNLTKKFNNIIQSCGKYFDDESVEEAKNIISEAKQIGITLDKSKSSEIFTKLLVYKFFKLSKNLEIQRVEGILKLFKQIDELEIDVNILEMQSIYFSKIYAKINEIICELNTSETKDEDRKLIYLLLEIGKKLNVDTNFYRELILKYDKGAKVS